MIYITNAVQIAATSFLFFLTSSNTCNTRNTRGTNTCNKRITCINTSTTPSQSQQQQQHSLLHHHTTFLLGARARHFRNSIDASFNDKIAIATTRLNSSSSSNSNNNSDSDSDDYRSIGEVVGGLHGGKYQFNDNSGNDYNYDYAGYYTSQNSCSDQDDERPPKEIPNWALQMSMSPSESASASALRHPEIINVPSNSNPMDGMIYSASVEIQNQERTWEEFHAKLVMKLSNGEYVEIDNGASSSGPISPISSSSSEATRIARPRIPVTLQPRSGSLAPRGGASNACDASKPYSDRVQIRVVQGQFSSIEDYIQDEEEVWLVVGTEEEKWYYLLKLER